MTKLPVDLLRSVSLLVAKFWLVTLAVVCATPHAGQAQTPGFEVVAGSDAVPAAAIEVTTEYVRDGLAEFAPMFETVPQRRIRVYIHDTTDSVPDRARGAFHPGTAGVALLRRDEIHIVLRESRRLPPNDLRTVVRHELVHVLLDQHAGRAAMWVPRWFHEGLAQVLSGASYIGMSEDDLVLIARSRRLLHFTALRDGFPTERSAIRRAYAQSFSLVRYLHSRRGLADLLEAARRSTPNGGFRAGFAAVTGESMLDYEEDWLEYLVDGSGASLRFVMQNCFSYVMLVGFVLLAFAGIRKWRREDRIRAKLEEQDRQAKAIALTFQPPPVSDSHPSPPHSFDRDRDS